MFETAEKEKSATEASAAHAKSLERKQTSETIICLISRVEEVLNHTHSLTHRYRHKADAVLEKARQKKRALLEPKWEKVIE